MILEINSKYPQFRYTVCHQSGGTSSQSDDSLHTLDDWMKWLDRLRDDLTGRELREAREAVLAPFTEPDYWLAFRQRFAATGDPWLA